MAILGQPLTEPESGWKRFDERNENIWYSPEWGAYGPTGITAPYYNGGCMYAHSNQAILKFNFTGTKIRMTGYTGSDACDAVDVYVDGIKYSLAQSYPSGGGHQGLWFELTGLENKEHSVQVESKSSTKDCYLDAIDLDVFGEIKSSSSNPIPEIIPPSNLTATDGDSKVFLSWSTVAGATGYNIKRSTTAGESYTTIATNVTDTGYVDLTVTNGTTYYYVVTAITANGESGNSNEASATPHATDTPPNPTTGLLRVTVIDSSERDYQLSTEDIDAFVNWFMNHTSADTTGHMLIKKVGTQSSKEYLAFDKIISFEVIPLAE